MNYSSVGIVIQVPKFKCGACGVEGAGKCLSAEINYPTGGAWRFPDALGNVLVSTQTERPGGWEQIKLVGFSEHINDDVFCPRCAGILKARLAEVQHIVLNEIGGGSSERADTTQNEVRSEREATPQASSPVADNCDRAKAGVEVVPAADETGRRKAHIKPVDELLSSFREMGMQLHEYHSNVGSVERMKEWAACRYTYCRRRFEVAYPDAGRDARAPSDAR